MSYLEDAIRQYCGRGEVYLNQKANKCAFEAGQLRDGRIRLVCTWDSFVADFDSHEHMRFNGLTDTGKRITITGHALPRKSNVSSISNEGITTSTYMTIYEFSGETHFEVGAYDQNQIIELHFAVTNLEFIGTEVEEVNLGHLRLNSIKLNLDGSEVVIRQSPDYDERLKALDTTKNVDVTAEIVVEATAKYISEILQLVDTLCALLSIAKGKKINWIFYDVFDANQNLVFTEHQPRITVLYTGVELIDHMPPENVPNFLGTCYPHYVALDSLYHFNRIVNAFVDVRSRGFLETRCLALFSLIEYLVRKTSTSGSLRQMLEATIKKYKAPISDTEVTSYIKTRNSLVHEMSFVTSDSRAEYFQVVHLLDKLVLCILGYDSYYINITNLPQASGGQSDKLTPTS